MLNCKEMTEVVTAYLEGELPLMSRMSIWLHLQMCKHCKNYFRQIETMARLSGQVPTIEMPPEVAESMASVLETAAAEWAAEGEDELEVEMP